MKIHLVAILALAFAGGTLHSQQSLPAQPQDDDEDLDPKIIARLTRDLGSDVYRTREMAVRRLRKVGDLALPFLRKQIDTPDLERKRRTADLIEELEARRGQLLCAAGHKGGIIALALLPGDRMALSASEDCSVRLWDLNSGNMKAQFDGHTKQVWALAVLPDGKSFVSAGQDHTVRQWSLANPHSTILATLPDGVRCLLVSPDGKHLLAGAFDAKIHVIDIAARKVVNTWSGHKDGVLCMDRSPDGRTIVSGGAFYDESICVRDAKTGEVRRRLLGHVQHICALAFIDNDHLVSAGYDQVIRLWNLRTDKVEQVFKGHTERIYGLAVSRDGKRLLSGAFDHQVVLWDLEQRTEICRYQRHEGGVNSLAFASNGKRALSGSDDRTLRLWEMPRIFKK